MESIVAVPAPVKPAPPFDPKQSAKVLCSRAAADILSIADITVMPEHHETLRRAVLNATELLERRFVDIVDEVKRGPCSNA